MDGIKVFLCTFYQSDTYKYVLWFNLYSSNI